MFNESSRNACLQDYFMCAFQKASWICYDMMTKEGQNWSGSVQEPQEVVPAFGTCSLDTLNLLFDSLLVI